MRTRLEQRAGRPAKSHRPGRWRRPVNDHVSALLILDGGTKKRLGTVEMPLDEVGRIEELVELSREKLLPLIPEDELRDGLLESVRQQARGYIEPPHRKEARLAREPEQYRKIRERAARLRGTPDGSDASTTKPTVEPPPTRTNEGGEE